MSLRSLWLLYRAYDAQGYVEWQATVDDVRSHTFHEHRRSFTTHYEIKYNYTYLGQMYDSSRARLAETRVKYSTLVAQAEEALRRRQTITVWVSPSDPTVSVLDRVVTEADLVPGTVAGFICGSLGYWLLYKEMAYLLPTHSRAYRALPLRRNLNWRRIYVVGGLVPVVPVLGYVLFYWGSAWAMVPLLCVGVCMSVLLGSHRRARLYEKIGDIEARLISGEATKSTLCLDIRLDLPKVLDKLELTLTCRLRPTSNVRNLSPPDPSVRRFSSKDFQLLSEPNTFRTTFEFLYVPQTPDTAVRLEGADLLEWELAVKAAKIDDFEQKIELVLESSA
jgi:hypothetical protein